MPFYRISQSRGTGSKGCRLDGGAIETLAAEVEVRLPGAQILVVNKLGKPESLGRGLRPAIAKALDLGLPVPVGVNGPNLPDFLAFTGGLAVPLPATPAAILARVRDATAMSEVVAV